MAKTQGLSSRNKGCPTRPGAHGQDSVHLSAKVLSEDRSAAVSAKRTSANVCISTISIQVDGAQPAGPPGLRSKIIAGCPKALQDSVVN